MAEHVATPRLRERAPLRPRTVVWRLAVWLLLLMGAVVVLLPFLYMLASSLETNVQIGALTPQFWPRPFQWVNYQSVWQE